MMLGEYILEAFTFEEEILEPTLAKEGNLKCENEKYPTLDEVKDNE